MARIGVLGGTFDPLHYGHLVIAEDAYFYLKLERVLFLPAYHPPHKTHRAYSSFEHRVRMVQLGIGGNPHFSLCLIEAEREDLSYTVDTLAELQLELGSEAELYFIIGMDSLVNLPTWYKPAELLSRCRLVVAERAGYQADLADLEAKLPGLKGRLDLIDTPELSISSTNLQQRVGTGLPIRYQVPAAVEEYVYAEGLYRGNGQRANERGRTTEAGICGEGDR